MAIVTSTILTAAAPPIQLAHLDGLHIAYRDSDDAGIQAGALAEPAILIHGLGSMIYTWQEVFAELALRRRVIALDLKGYGASDKPAGDDYSLTAQAELVAGLLAELGIKQAALIGNSMGGAVALLLAARY
jgi:pimeloyl-ACP methyl ester carboxylesterase